MSGKVVIGAELQLQSAQALENVGKVKQALRESQKALHAAQSEFGEFSQQAIAAAKNVAALKDRLGDAANLVDAFNPDQKFKAFSNSLNGVVGGVTAVQGVMGLLGSESEDVQKTLLKVQSAMAFSQGLNSVLDSIQSFKSLGIVVRNSTIFIKANEAANKAAAFAMKLFGVSVNTTSTSFKVLKGAIAATGIGALLLLVGEAVALFDQLSSAAEEAAEAQQKAFETREKYANAAMTAEEKYIATQQKLDVARAKKAGKSEKEVFEIEQMWQRQRIKSVERYVAEVGTQNEKGYEASLHLKDLQAEMEISKIDFEADVNKKRLDQQSDYHKKALERQKAAAQKERDQREADRRAAQDMNADLGRANTLSGASSETERKLLELQFEYEEKKKIIQKGEGDLSELIKWFNTQRQQIILAGHEEELQKDREARDKKFQEEQAAFQHQIERSQQQAEAFRIAAEYIATNEEMSYRERMEMIDAAEKTLNETVGLRDEERTAKEKALSDARKEIARQEYEHKTNMANLTTNVLGAFAEVAGQQTGVGKALAIAATTISTIQAAQDAYRNQMTIPEPSAQLRAVLAAAAALAAGYAKVRAITQVKIPGGRGAGASAPSLSAGGGAPLTPGLGNNVTRLDQDTINNLGNRAIKTFVTETDVTTSQETIRRINRQARIG
jgi:hypothetical protein